MARVCLVPACVQRLQLRRLGSRAWRVFSNNGVPFQQMFRPTHFTAGWTNGALSEVRIRGPRVLKDGGLGSRLLDHCWNRRPVSLDSLPKSVADQIRSYESRVS